MESKPESWHVGLSPAWGGRFIFGGLWRIRGSTKRRRHPQPGHRELSPRPPGAGEGEKNEFSRRPVAVSIDRARAGARGGLGAWLAAAGAQLSGKNPGGCGAEISYRSRGGAALVADGCRPWPGRGRGLPGTQGILLLRLNPRSFGAQLTALSSSEGLPLQRAQPLGKLEHPPKLGLESLLKPILAEASVLLRHPYLAPCGVIHTIYFIFF